LTASHETITDQDIRLLNLVIREGRPAAILLNFWDKLDAHGRKHFLEDSEFADYLKHFRVIPVSGLTGFNTQDLLSIAWRLYEKSQKRVKTSKLNQLVSRIVSTNPPPTAGRQNFNILYASQVKVDPPTFVFFMNRKGSIPLSYQRYLENQLRNKLGLKSQAVRVLFRGRDRDL
jgi:GTP-binding protein